MMGLCLQLCMVIVSLMSTKAQDTCGGTFLNVRGVIRSPNYPRKYPNSAHCIYNVLASNDAVLKINCRNMNIQVSPGCERDYFEINGVKYCGKRGPRNIRSTSQMTIIFHSDDSINKRKGFSCNYRRISGCPYNDSTTLPSTTTSLGTGCVAPGSTYNYDEVLHKSLLFYEAQRSGHLPATQRVTWRKDSATNDATDDATQQHVDLEGGYYDAGDFMKFGYPMASMTTVLAWGAIEYSNAYIAAGEMSYMKEAVKWATDYFLKAHPEPNVFYGQVGNGTLDHDVWGRPEDMTMYRPAFKLTTSKPGSDLAGETAAALAATSILFQDSDATYAATCLRHAEELYNFANQYRGQYASSITDAKEYYNSWGTYYDELAWAAAWLYRATRNSSYLTQAVNHYANLSPNDVGEFSWAEKTPGVQVLLAEYAAASDRSRYQNDLIIFCNKIVDETPRTPKGLVFIAKWGSLRYAANAAFVCLRAADLGINPDKYRAFGKLQIHYMLGDGGRSFVVGFGNNPPVHPHHKSSSCPSAPAPCGWDNLQSVEPNAHELTGALVGGPDEKDNYVDDRTDYVKNEVTTDYNAGFQSAVAALRQLANCVSLTTVP